MSVVPNFEAQWLKQMLEMAEDSDYFPGDDVSNVVSEHVEHMMHTGLMLKLQGELDHLEGEGPDRFVLLLMATAMVRGLQVGAAYPDVPTA